MTVIPQACAELPHGCQEPAGGLELALAALCAKACEREQAGQQAQTRAGRKASFPDNNILAGGETGRSVNQGKGEFYGAQTHTHTRSGSHTLQVRRGGQNSHSFSHQPLPQQLLSQVLPTASYLLGENATGRMGGPGLQFGRVVTWSSFLPASEGED